MASAAAFVADPNEFTAKRVLVTGGTQGTGEAIVRRLRAGGAKVATSARSFYRTDRHRNFSCRPTSARLQV
jgi:NADP-dependent 3-hydroxy acid dehydrogenase YdfG